MKTWRERIAEARDRGRFTDADRAAWASPMKCLVGETVRQMWGEYDSGVWCRVNWSNYSLGVPHDALQDSLQEGLCDALLTNDFDFVERRLDAIEDRALELKRRQ